MNTSSMQLQTVLVCVAVGIVAALAAAVVASLRGRFLEAAFELGGGMFLGALAAGIRRTRPA